MSGLDDADGSPGGRYEAALSPEERRADGQFYTPPAIARALVEWALAAPSTGETDATTNDESLPRILDPAAGAGAFALAAHDRLVSALDATPEAAVDRIALVDVNGRPLSLAAEALADRTGVTPNAVRTRTASFFDCQPGALLHDGGNPPGFDAVVGNPPFVRHEDLDDKDHYRDHLAALGPGGESPYRDGDRAPSGRSDASVYFLTHATRFLRPGGRLAFVAPRKWLTARYGESLRAFVADHYRVAAVATFPDRAFDGALVDTLLVLLERRADPEGPARLVGFSGRPDGGALVAAACGSHGRSSRWPDDGPAGDRHGRGGTDGPPGSVVSEQAVSERAGRRVVDLPRGRFRDAAKLAHYLDAPRPVLELLGSDALAPLGALADVTYGYKTGANDFFFLDREDRERWPVADRFLSPAVTSLRQVDGRAVSPADVDTAVLDVHDYVEGVLGDGTGAAAADSPATASAGDPAATVEAALARDGHDVLRSYVERGERRGYDERSTCAARRVWFDLGPLDPPAVLHPKFFDERVVVARNRGGLVPSNAIDCLRLCEGVAPAALLGALNSTLHRTLLECFGRAEGGGALQLMTYELSAVSVLDIRALSGGHRRRIAGAFEAVVAAESEWAGGGADGDRADSGRSDGGDDDSSDRADGVNAAMNRLDRAVLDAAGAAVTVERLRDCRREMVARRRGEGGP